MADQKQPDNSIPIDVTTYTVNTIYVVFIGLLFSSLFDISPNSEPLVRLLIDYDTMPVVVLLAGLIIFDWMLENFYRNIGQRTSDIFAILVVIRIIALGIAFLYSLNVDKTKYFMIGIFMLLDCLSSLCYYRNKFGHLLSRDGMKILREKQEEIMGAVTRDLVHYFAQSLRFFSWVYIGAKFLCGCLAVFLFLIAPSKEQLDTTQLNVLVGIYVLLELVYWILARSELGARVQNIHAQFERFQ